MKQFDEINKKKYLINKLQKELEIKQAENVVKANLLITAKNKIKRWELTYTILFSISLIITLIGFIKWYFYTQRLTELKLNLEIKKLKQEIES